MDCFAHHSYYAKVLLHSQKESNYILLCKSPNKFTLKIFSDKLNEIRLSEPNKNPNGNPNRNRKGNPNRNPNGNPNGNPNRNRNKDANGNKNKQKQKIHIKGKWHLINLKKCSNAPKKLTTTFRICNNI